MPPPPTHPYKIGNKLAKLHNSCFIAWRRIKGGIFHHSFNNTLRHPEFLPPPHPIQMWPPRWPLQTAAARNAPECWFYWHDCRDVEPKHKHESHASTAHFITDNNKKASCRKQIQSARTFTSKYHISEGSRERLLNRWHCSPIFSLRDNYMVLMIYCIYSPECTI